MDDQNSKTTTSSNTNQDLSHITQEMYKKNFELAEKNKTLSLLRKIDEIVLGAVTDVKQVAQQVVDVTAVDAEFKAVALYLVDRINGRLQRIAVSQTKFTQDFITNYHYVPYVEEIRLSATNNLIAFCIKEKKMQLAHEMISLMQPYISEETKDKLSGNIDIITSFVYPLIVRGEIIGTLIISIGQRETDVSEEHRELIERLVGVVGIAVDNALLYQRIQDANRRLKELDKLKDEFVSVASHELRTPMTAIKSYLWMALAGKGGTLTAKQEYYVQRAYNSVDRLIKLVNDMLNISRIESGRLSIEMQQVALPKLTQEVIEEVLPRAQELGIHVQLQAAEGLPTVVADPDKIKEVLFNLIGNSLKFTNRGGSVTVTLSRNGDMVETTVSDTGVGLDHDDIPKLFQKFGLLPGSYVTNQPMTGTGLGLYICKSIINLHEGEIWASSEGRGRGTKFTFSLMPFKQDDLERFTTLYSGRSKDPVGLIHTQL